VTSLGSLCDILVADLGSLKSVGLTAIFGAIFMKTFTLRLNDDDHKLFTAIAEAEDLPINTLIRRVVKQYAREHGHLQKPQLAITQPAITQPAITQPAITQPTTLQPPLKDTTLNNESLLKRLESGEQLTAIAQTSNLTVSELQTRIAKAKKARTDGTLAANEAAVDFMQCNPAPSPEHRLTRISRADGAGFDFAWKAPDHQQPVQPLKTSEDTTESDAVHNAELARQRLLSLGFDI
jgi:predicted DNA-binding ribbon-helix-helix protein